jgi:GNAT superfamily N-acetyltransferase
MMDRRTLLASYDEELRRNAPYFDDAVRLERDGSVVRLLGATADPGNNCVLYADLDESGAAAAVDRQIDYFRGLGRSFEWKWHEHDRPAGLDDLLKSRGFAADGDETIVVQELARRTTSPRLPAGYETRPWPDSEPLDALMEVQAAVWPGDHSWLVDSLKRERAAKPESIRFHAVWNGGRPVCLGWTRLHGRFASLFGGSTLSEHRGRGAYRALLAARLDEAAARGAEYALVDAGPMSRPILERLGFSALTRTVPFVHRLFERTPE